MITDTITIFIVSVKSAGYKKHKIENATDNTMVSIDLTHRILEYLPNRHTSFLLLIVYHFVKNLSIPY